MSTRQYKKKKINKFNRPVTSLLEEYNKCVNACKADALKKGNQMAKKDLIGGIVGNLIFTNIAQIRPVPILFQRYMDGERISLNRILDSIGANGVILGALAYLVAEQLEIELPDTEVKSKEKMVVAYIDGQEVPDISYDKIPISSAYQKYFSQNEDAMFLQNSYLYRLIGDDKTSYSEYHARIAEAFLEMQLLCHDEHLMKYIHDCLKSIYLNEFSSNLSSVNYNFS